MLRKIETAFVVVVLCLMAGAIGPVLYVTSDWLIAGRLSGYSAIQIFLAMAQGIGLFVLIRRGPPRVSLPFGMVIGALAFWVLLSSAWSGLPQVTLTRGATLVGTCFFSFYLASSFDSRTFLHLLGLALLLAAASSLALALLAPEVGVMRTGLADGAWKGAFSHKNQLGGVSGLSIWVFLLLAAINKRRTIWISGLVLALALIIRSESATAMLVTMGIFLCLLCLLFIQKRRSWGIAAFFFLLACGLILINWLVSHWEAVTGFMEKSATLTGRTGVWKASIDSAMMYPWTGYGYGAFWVAPDGPAATATQQIGQAQVNSHNGFLELWLGIGLVGLALFSIYLLWFARKSLVYYVQKPTTERAAPFAFLWFYVTINLTEATFLLSNSLFLVIALYYSALLARRIEDDGQCGAPVVAATGSLIRMWPSVRGNR
jgi:O-antigen ligase